MEEGEPGPFFMKAEKAHLPAEATMVALPGHLQAVKVLLQLFGRGEGGRVQQLAERSLALCQGRSEMQEDAADAVMLMGELAYSAGDPARGQELHEQALAVFHNLDTPKAAAWALLDLGRQTYMRGDLVRARELHEKSVAMWRCLDDRSILGVSLDNLGAVLIPLGELERSRALLLESLSILLELKSSVVDWPVVDLGIWAQAWRQPVRAVRLLGAADTLRQPTGRSVAVRQRREYDRAVASLRAQLGEEAFAAAWCEGQALSLAQAAALAMSDEP